MLSNYDFSCFEVCNGVMIPSNDLGPRVGETFSAFDVGTGRSLWEATGGGAFVRGDQVVYSSGTSVKAVDLQSGLERWGIDLPGEGPPTASGERIFDRLYMIDDRLYVFVKQSVHAVMLPALLG